MIGRVDASEIIRSLIEVRDTLEKPRKEKKKKKGGFFIEENLTNWQKIDNSIRLLDRMDERIDTMERMYKDLMDKVRLIVKTKLKIENQDEDDEDEE